MKKKLATMVLAVALTLSMAIPVSAEEAEGLIFQDGESAESVDGAAQAAESVVTDDADSDKADAADAENVDEIVGAVSASGTCGSNLTWTLTDGGTLTVSGTGEMCDLDADSSWASKDKSKIKKVVIESGVTSIGKGAFDSCSELTDVTIPSSVKTIGNCAFYGCYNFEFTKINIPSGVTSIGYAAFSNCLYLKDISIPSSVTSIGDYAFSGIASGGSEQYSLTSITIPSGVMYIGTGAFDNCEFLTGITIPDTVTSIGTFKNCYYLKDITIPSGVTKIEPDAFSNCISLTEMKIPESVKEIGSGAFSGCEHLKHVVIPGTVTTLSAKQKDSAIFKDCTELKTAGPIGGDYNIEFGWTDSIPDFAFYGDNELTSVTLPDSITSIGRSSFQFCNKLANVNIPENVTSMDIYAFYGCKALTEITIPAKMSKVEDRAFCECDNLKNITVKSKDVALGTRCLGYTIVTPNPESKIDGVTIHGYSGSTAQTYATENGFTFVEEGSATSGSCGDKAVWSLSGDTLTISGTGAMYDYGYSNTAPWYGNEAVKKIVISDGITSIGKLCFTYCPALTTVEIAGTVTSIGDNAFSSCRMLSDIQLPNSITSIGEQSFSACYSLSDIKIPSGVTSIKKGTFFECAVQNITIPDSVTEIGSIAFKGCTKLTEITIPDSVTTIGSYAFSNCDSLKSITIKNKSAKIEDKALGYKVADDNTSTAIDGVVIHGYTGSTAETYAKDNGFEFSAISENSTAFKDVPTGKYYTNAVTWAVSKGITTGTGNNQFSPDEACSRGQVVTFLWRAYGSPEPTTTTSKFTDVQDPKKYYYKAVLWAVEKGITAGTSATTFSPEATVTRGQFVTFIYRAEGKPEVTGASKFTDVQDSSKFYYYPVIWAVGKGVTNGTSATTFSPTDPCTRGQVVTFLYRDLK